ncbi:GWxTD domain-containing protein [Aquiflexum sp. LQ15W]|uniref:GWxTD domain-containing protein n=1 Tax=Cognataquiflexum nitidum TaxID=2922272 RepID=UPI001F1446F3|nr:GWxTD domain-containing protein [Cognataquiflexum nitidum]MCH6200356.1 GWxTD domain-containing protein [Cognataquiflexum nitidum]
MIGQKISNKIKPITGLALFLFCIPSIILAQQNLETVNQALRYSRYSRISLKIIPIEEPNRTFLLQMPVEKIEEDIEFGSYEFYYGVVSSFQEPLTDQNLIRLNVQDIIRETDYHYFFEKRVTVPEGQQMAIALIKAVDTRQGDEYFYHMDLISPFIFGHSNFGVYYEDKIPFDQNFLIQNEPVELKGRGIVNLHTFFYPNTFDVPMPPMEIRPAPVPREVKVEYQGSFLANLPKAFAGEGYYFIQSDTNSTQGVMLKTVHDIFPRVKDYEEMVDMVTYISTRREHELLKEAADKKIALDQYWYTLTKDTVSAKKLIKEYFKQIEFANILFTDFKEGWKTDRGMVYTVMGPPNEVYFRMDSESWSYGTPDSISKITFTFARVKNILTPSFYTLNRSRALQPEWFKSITLWRNAQMDF